jgi:repressor LexA
MLTARQADIYRFIQGYIARHGHGPLLTEIADGVGIHSKGTVHRYVSSLAQAGLIELVPGRHRGIRLPEPTGVGSERGLALRLVGKIAAGRPIEAIPGLEEINLADLFRGANRFVLRVQGDSMVEAGILDSDMVIVEKREWGDNDALVVALIDHQEATLKRIRYNSDGTVTLFPANRALSPVTYPSERVCIQGVVVGQMRSYR